MDWTSLLFRFQGRINRGKYWLALLVYMVAWTVFLAATLLWLGRLDNLFSLAGAGLLIWLAFIVLFVAGIWSGLATGIKRLQDRNKSGWWIVLFWIVPSVLSGSSTVVDDMGSGGFLVSLAAIGLSIWGFVELACLRGTVGPNDYGPDPLDPTMAPARI